MHLLALTCTTVTSTFTRLMANCSVFRVCNTCASPKKIFVRQNGKILIVFQVKRKLYHGLLIFWIYSVMHVVIVTINFSVLTSTNTRSWCIRLKLTQYISFYSIWGFAWISSSTDVHSCSLNIYCSKAFCQNT